MCKFINTSIYERADAYIVAIWQQEYAILIRTPWGDVHAVAASIVSHVVGFVRAVAAWISTPLYVSLLRLRRASRAWVCGELPIWILLYVLLRKQPMVLMIVSGVAATILLSRELEFYLGGAVVQATALVTSGLSCTFDRRNSMQCAGMICCRFAAFLREVDRPLPPRHARGSCSDATTARWNHERSCQRLFASRGNQRSTYLDAFLCAPTRFRSKIGDTHLRDSSRTRNMLPLISCKATSPIIARQHSGCTVIMNWRVDILTLSHVAVRFGLLT